MFISYTPTRDIDSGAGEIELSDIAKFDRTIIPESFEEKSQSGKQETTLNRIEYEYDCQTDLVASAGLAKWREFAASVIAGETFSFDAFGTQSSPDDVLSVRMVKKSFKETRSGTSLFRFSFRLRKVL